MITKSIRTLAALACALLLPAVAMAQTQPLPAARGASGTYLQNTPDTPCFAPAGGGLGTCRYQADDSPAPTGGVQVVVSQTPTVTSSSVYATGQSVGGLLTFSGAARVQNGGANGTGILQRVTIHMKSTQTGPFDLVLFSQAPTNTTIADKTTFSLATADYGTVMGVIHLSDCTSLGAPSSCVASGLAFALRTVGSGNLYGALVSRGTPTFASTSDVTVSAQIIQD